MLEVVTDFLFDVSTLPTADSLNVVSCLLEVSVLF
ncbi:U-spanin, partial [Klebsiella phage vB_KpnS-VAC9]